MDLTLRPRGASEIIDAAFRLYRRHFVAFLTLAIVAVSPQLLSDLLTASGGASGVGVGAGLAVAVVYIAVLTVTTGAFALLADDAVRGHGTDVVDAVRRTLGRVWEIIGTLILFALAFAAGLVLLVIPGLYVALRLTTVVPTCMVEEVGPTEALRRSWARGRGHVWHTFGALALAALVAFIPIIAAGAVTAILGGEQAAGGARVTAALVTAACSALVQPLFPLATQVLYYDLRVRAEAFDLELMAGALAAPGAAAGARA